MKGDDAISSVDKARTAAELYAATHLQPNLTFDTFVIGRANKPAIAAARKVVRSPGRKFNPLFISGGVAVGKTHLLHAIGNAAFESNSFARIRYVHAEDFFADMNRAYQENSREAFSRYYRSLDLLLVDDIQHFRRKERTQEEFFNVFNELIKTGGQIVVASDTHLKDIDGLEERLVSRFYAGLPVAIESAKRKLRTGILRRLAERRGMELKDDVAKFVAKRLRANARELEGTVNRFLLDEHVHHRQVTRAIAGGILEELFNRPSRTGLRSIWRGAPSELSGRSTKEVARLKVI